MADNLSLNNLSDPAVEAFLDSCLWDKGIKEVPKELHDQMIADLADRLQSWLMQALFAKLEEKDIPDMDALVEKQASQEEIMQFLKSRIPNLDEIFKQEMEAFKKAYIKA